MLWYVFSRAQGINPGWPKTPQKPPQFHPKAPSQHCIGKMHPRFVKNVPDCAGQLAETFHTIPKIIPHPLPNKKNWVEGYGSPEIADYTSNHWTGLFMIHAAKKGGLQATYFLLAIFFSASAVSCVLLIFQHSLRISCNRQSQPVTFRDLPTSTTSLGRSDLPSPLPFEQVNRNWLHLIW